MTKQIIGIVGGIGPLAGIDLCKRIVENTIASSDQKHVPFLLASIPNEIDDRTEYLLRKTIVNPAFAIVDVIARLEKSGATLIGIACNTAHATQIFDVILSELHRRGSKVEVLNMIDETIQYIKIHTASPQEIGVMSTLGTYKSNLYQNKLSEVGLKTILLDFDRHNFLVHNAIYHPQNGIKSSTQISDESIQQLNLAITELKSKGAQGIILGCTEIAMIEERINLQGLISINPSRILARALIARTFPEKLREPIRY